MRPCIREILYAACDSGLYRLIHDDITIIVIGGTNGKGSCGTWLASLYQHAGYRVGHYLSPHLQDERERIRIQGQWVNQIDWVPHQRPLTYFEHITLSACLMFVKAKLDIWIMEVGMGGQWDGVNILDAHLAILTSIDLDHTEFLGPTREHIGKEKSGIMRACRPTVCGDANPPISVQNHAKRLHQTSFFYKGRDFDYILHEKHWDWSGFNRHYANLPIPQLYPENVACALAGASLLQHRCPVGVASIHHAMSATLPGRCEMIAIHPHRYILDVAHNPGAMRRLIDRIQSLSIQAHRKVVCIFGMLQDKDFQACLQILAPWVDQWFLTSLHHPDRGRIIQPSDLPSFIYPERVTYANHPNDAWHQWLAQYRHSASGVDVWVLGSFYLVGDIRNILMSYSNSKVHIPTPETEKQGFEPWEGGCPSTVFKTAAFNHSATSPLPE